LIQRDLVRGYISPEAALRDYGATAIAPASPVETRERTTD
jgi:hypothetical protein